MEQNSSFALVKGHKIMRNGKMVLRIRLRKVLHIIHESNVRNLTSGESALKSASRASSVLLARFKCPLSLEVSLIQSKSSWKDSGMTACVFSDSKSMSSIDCSRYLWMSSGVDNLNSMSFAVLLSLSSSSRHPSSTEEIESDEDEASKLKRFWVCASRNKERRNSLLKN